MKSKNRFLAILVVMLLAILACSTVATNGDGDQVLFQDDFSDPSSGWDQVRSDDGITDYENGIYRILVLSEDMDIWANPNLNFTDVRIEVDATKSGGPDNNDFGVICRYKDVENYYFMIISSDGYYGIGKKINGEYEIIGTEFLPPSEEINQGKATNQIRADCVASSLSLYVNGKLIDTQEDSDFSSGDVGLIAGTYETIGTDIHFDNFRVLKP
jgi:hypothetical protein